MAVSDGTDGEVPHPAVGAIVVAAGESRRMAGVDKIFALLEDRPLISHSIEVFQGLDLVTDVVLVLSPGSIDRGRRLIEAEGWSKVRDVCAGGDRRQDSVRNGLERLPECQWVVVHDGARPFIDEGLVARGLEEARPTGASVAGVPVKDTIKSASPDGVVKRTLQRDELWAVQTPQIFRRQLLEDAHRRISEDVTDDAAMVEALGVKTKIFMGSYQNIKITTPEDLVLAEAIARSRQ